MKKQNKKNARRKICRVFYLCPGGVSQHKKVFPFLWAFLFLKEDVMKKMLVLLFVLLFSVPAFADVFVSGYTRKDGTYVQPHYRSDPDGNTYNNWSTKGNVNPYTGDFGTKQPYYPGRSRRSSSNPFTINHSAERNNGTFYRF